jgi:hypothetical protein
MDNVPLGFPFRPEVVHEYGTGKGRDSGHVIIPKVLRPAPLRLAKNFTDAGLNARNDLFGHLAPSPKRDSDKKKVDPKTHVDHGNTPEHKEPARASTNPFTFSNGNDYRPGQIGSRAHGTSNFVEAIMTSRHLKWAFSNKTVTILIYLARLKTTSKMKTLTLHAHSTGPNPYKVAILLDAPKLAYNVRLWEFGDAHNGVKGPVFLKINENWFVMQDTLIFPHAC